jgi:ribosomal protein S14
MCGRVWCDGLMARSRAIWTDVPSSPGGSFRRCKHCGRLRQARATRVPAVPEHQSRVSFRALIHATPGQGPKDLAGEAMEDTRGASWKSGWDDLAALQIAIVKKRSPTLARGDPFPSFPSFPSLVHKHRRHGLHPHRADLELGDLGVRIQPGIREQVGGRLTEVEGDEDLAAGLAV